MSHKVDVVTDTGLATSGSPAVIVGKRRRGLVPAITWHLQRYWQLWLMALPAVSFLVLFAYVPMYGLQLAFRNTTLRLA